jgi:AcrR family transcriptional regulator
MTRRRAELLDSAYAYAVEHGLADLSLRPLAAATATSPRVLLYLFGSKDGLVREILTRARREQLALVAEAVGEARRLGEDPYPHLITRLWAWLSTPEQRNAIRLFFEAYILSLRPDAGPWEGFAEQSVRDWVDILVAAEPDHSHRQAIQTLALLRGSLLHLLAGGDPDALAEAVRTGPTDPSAVIT